MFGETKESPSDHFPGRVPTDIAFSAVLVLVITANVAVIFKCQIYRIFNSMVIMTFLTLLQTIRLITFLVRIFQDKYSEEQWVWYRVQTDLCSYLLSIVNIILLMQWYQTYQVLADPLEAAKTIEKNWTKIVSIVLMLFNTFFVLFDIIMIFIDANSGRES